MSRTPTSDVKIVFGCMTFGESGVEQAHVHSLSECQEIIDIFSSHGHTELDTARMYGQGTSEAYLARLGAIDEQYKLGRFNCWGLSNYRADEVEEILSLCDRHGWIKPIVYQGVYNAITRSAEPDLFPVLRKHNMAFYTFNPLGGDLIHGSQGAMYRKRYWNDTYFRALEEIRPVVDKHGLTMAEVALRWMTHHSQLDKKHDDAILIGASSIKHIDQNLFDLEKGPLDAQVVQVVDRAWKFVEPQAPPYHH